MYWAIGAYLLLCFPLIITPRIYYNSNIGKVFFSLAIFGINILSGYIRLKGATIYFHFSRKKALAVRLINTRQMLKGNVDVFRSIEVFYITFYIDLPLDEKSVPAAGAINFLKSVLLPVYLSRKPFLKTEDRLFIGRQDHIGTLFEATIVFNLITILSLIFRKVKNSLWTNIKKKSKT